MSRTVSQVDPDLRALLDALAAHLPDPPPSLLGWQLRRIEGGHNGLLFRAEQEATTLAVKFTRRDARDRAGREFETLRALQQIDPTLAPVPLLLDRTTYPHPVVVQSWLAGTCSANLPSTPAEWGLLVKHYCAIHRIRPEHVVAQLPPAVLTITHARDGVQRVLDAWQYAPPEAYPDAITDLVRDVKTRRWPEWDEPPRTLSRLDPNITNFIRFPTHWASVDWENSGWGDPAFELGDLMAHPAYIAVPGSHWEAVAGAYCEADADESLPLRIRTHYALVLAYWAVFFAREVYFHAEGIRPQGRLVDRPAEWYATLPEKARHYADAVARALQSIPT